MLTRAPEGLPPIVQSAERLLVCIEQAVRGFPRDHKYTLGADLRRQAMTTVRGIAPMLQRGSAAACRSSGAVGRTLARRKRRSHAGAWERSNNSVGGVLTPTCSRAGCDGHVADESAPTQAIER